MNQGACAACSVKPNEWIYEGYRFLPEEDRAGRGKQESLLQGQKYDTVSPMHFFIISTGGDLMSRQTITLSDEVWIALKETSIKRKKPVGQIIEESLRAYGIKTRENALDLLRMAQKRSNLSEEEALALGIEETRKTRRR
jgi:predicted CopG family antitoxin